MSSRQLPSHMRAAQLHKHHQPYEIVTTPVPQPQDHELLVQVHAAGFCHSDLQVIDEYYDNPLPLIPGHEPAGVIVGVGPGCSGSWSVGDRVGVMNCKNACGACPSCAVSLRRYGRLDPRFCERRQMAGFNHHGAMAEYMVADPTTTIALPPNVAFDQAATLMCAGATVWGALEKATKGLESGAAVAVIGIGGLGHLGVQFAKATGFRVIALDNREAGRALATEVPSGLSPDLVVGSSDEAAAKKTIFDFTAGEGVAAAVVCTEALAVNAWTLSLLRIGGVMVPLGLPPESWRFDPQLLVFRELSILGSYVASAEATGRMMDMVERHGIASSITRVAFEHVGQLTHRYMDKDFKGRLVVTVVGQE